MASLPIRSRDFREPTISCIPVLHLDLCLLSGVIQVLFDTLDARVHPIEKELSRRPFDDSTIVPHLHVVWCR